MNSYMPTNWTIFRRNIFPVSHNLSKTKSGINNLNRSITTAETEIVIKALKKPKVQVIVSQGNPTNTKRKFNTYSFFAMPHSM